MQSYYEINVSHMGRHFFATAPRSLLNETDARFMVSIFRERFLKADGYEISCTHWDCVGHRIITREDK